MEEQVAEELLLVDDEPNLPPHEGESLAELEQELADVVDERLLHVALDAFVDRAEEVEQVRVAGGLLGEVGVGLGQRAGEVGDRPAGSLVEARLDVEGENVATPPLLDRRGGVPEPQVCVVELLQQGDVVVPGQCCKGALQNRRIWPGHCERAHVAEVAR